MGACSTFRSVCNGNDFYFGDEMRAETALFLQLADTIENYGRETLLKDVELLIAQKKYYTCDELAVRYGVTIQTLKNWENDGRLVPDLRVGKGCVRYSAAVISEFERKHPGKGAWWAWQSSLNRREILPIF